MKIFAIILIAFTYISSFGQNNVGIGTLTPNPQAILEVNSNDKGVLISRLTTLARNTLGTALTALEDGMLVYDKDMTTFFYWDGPNLQWVQVGSGTGDDWGAQTVQTSGTNISGNGTTGNPLIVTDADSDPNNEIELPTGGVNGQVISTDGNGNYSWIDDNNGTDNQDLTLTGNTLSLTNDVTTVDLSTLKDHDWYEVGGTTQPDAITDDIFTQGNVGIGLTNPNAKLDVNGDILYSANASTLFKITSVSDNIHLNMIKASTNSVNAQILLDGYGAPQDQGQIRFFTRWDPVNGGPGTLDHAMSIIENGNIGIGTSTPTSKLHILDGAIHQEVTTDVNHAIRLSNRVTNKAWHLYHLSGTDGNPNGFTLENLDGTYKRRLSIDNEGDVLINGVISDPSAKLEVRSTDKGFLPPRIALSGHNDVTTITAPVEGLLVYNTATAGTGIQSIEPGYYYFNGTIWKPVGENSDWYLDNTNSFMGGIPLNTSATVPTTANRLYTNYVNLKKGVYQVSFYDCLSSASANYYVQSTAESSSPNDFASGFMNYNFNERTSFSHAPFIMYVKKDNTPVRFYVYNPSSGTATLTIPNTVNSCSSFYYYKISE